MWLGMKRMERFAKAHLSPVSKPRHINSIFKTVNTPIYMCVSFHDLPYFTLMEIIKIAIIFKIRIGIS